MIKIEKTSFGYKSIFSGIISLEEIETELEASHEKLADSPKTFSVLVDLRNIEILPVECQQVMNEGQRLFKKMGMVRSVLVVTNQLTIMQFKRLAKKAGIIEGERFINASSNLNWEKEAMNWLLNSIEPTLEKELIK